MKQANIITLIDLQNGFVEHDISQAKGGCLYVPDGEYAIEPAANLLWNAKNKIFVLSQDFHPADHISFMENHPGIMALRRSQLGGRYSAEAVLNPTLLPFTNILVKQMHGFYVPVATNVDGLWRKVKTSAEGYITHVEDEEISTKERAQAFEQTLWRKHCVQGTYSALFCDEIMGILPEGLQHSLRTDITLPVLHGIGHDGNIFFVIRKGMRRDLDSYGIATENDGISQTQAPAVFRQIAAILKDNGMTHADIDIGGLATNFCTEFSEKDLQTFLDPILAGAGITSKIRLLSDISYGIPVSVPDGSWPDLANATTRMAAHGTTVRTASDVLRASLKLSANSNPLKYSLE